MQYYDNVRAAADWLQSRIGALPDVAVVLGSGLGDFANRLADAVTIPYGEIPHWPASAVVGHAGRLVAGTLAGRRVAALSGRAHYYEGHTPPTITFATRVLGLLRVPALILTNAAGGVNKGFKPGTLMVIDDHLNLMGCNPLIGANDDRFGVRFPDMSEVYSARLRGKADDASRATGVAVAHGVYAALAGPSYETPAEIRYLRTVGADAVGMSTVPEAIVARHMGMEVLGVSCITNPAAGVLPRPLKHDEVMEVANRVRGEFSALLEATIERL
ncbi:MAG: purine-nucleoside phosphorylase [Acidobacteria bacterium RIFCSPLOWO2_02_FULL_67_36]|nr:MAG: purine-nucleoside phosphorylase [Acidobacteria bacterium RIFCSPLOWO2_02_FULL_67_36]OFW21349.1 MAG: purine-nucleoside phosphorylase [Acidobacteria bacterium RIFCSPLOWO2_12_FULL_66_21]